MKKLFIAICASFIAMWSVGAMAEKIGVVDMQKIFQNSSKAKSINQTLQTQFASRKAQIVKLGQQLREEMQSYQKNQSVMDKTKLEALKNLITQHGTSLREEQTKFQSDLMTEQNQKMAGFLKDLRSAVVKVAEKDGLDIVLPNNAVLYSKDGMNITSAVLDQMK